MRPARALFAICAYAAVAVVAAEDQTSVGAGSSVTVNSDNTSAVHPDSNVAGTVLVYDVLYNVTVGEETVGGDDGIIYELTDEQYYAMPKLFELDEYEGCLALRGVYCLGSFELIPRGTSALFDTMRRYSNNWADNFNHTRLHRGVCLPRACPPRAAPSREPRSWFESCVNASTMSTYNLTARLYHLEYCTRGETSPPLSTSEKAFLAVCAVLLALTALSTGLDLMLPDHSKKGLGWALSWSVRESWRSLTAPAPASSSTDLRSFDGLRVFCMLCVILEHVCWLATLSYVADTRYYEQVRRATDVVLMTNSTLVVQIFFLMASFLLAHKLLQQRTPQPALGAFINTMINRIIRISPSYFLVIWFASSWWERLGGGPQWGLVRSEAQICRQKWWTHLLYLNNMLYPDDKCLIQTWYLAADMQLYALALALTLLLRGRRLAVPALAALFVCAALGSLLLAYALRLVPTVIVHSPESVRRAYSGDASFNQLYQSAWGNAAGALAGLLLAHAHHALSTTHQALYRNKVFRWVSMLSCPAALCWAALSPLALGAGPPARGAAAALAALERPVFLMFVAVALLGAINGIKSPWRSWLSSVSPALARLSFGALLLHLPLNKALLASRARPTQLDREAAIFDWFGVAVVSYAAAFPLAILVEIPAQRLYRELSLLRKPEPRRAPDKTDLTHA